MIDLPVDRHMERSRRLGRIGLHRVDLEWPACRPRNQNSIAQYSHYSWLPAETTQHKVDSEWGHREDNLADLQRVWKYQKEIDENGSHKEWLANGGTK